MSDMFDSSNGESVKAEPSSFRCESSRKRPHSGNREGYCGKYALQAVPSPKTEYGITSILYERYFVIMKELRDSNFQQKRNGLMVQCRICNAHLKGYRHISSNFVRHLRLKHEEEYKEYELLRKNYKGKHADLEHYTSVSFRGNGESIPPSKHPQPDQEHFDNLTLRLIVQQILPLSLVEASSFRELIACANHTINVMSTQQTLHKLNEIYTVMMTGIKESLKEVAFVCVTADVLSTNDQHFFGYTCHWLDESFQRHSVALACKRFSGCYTQAKRYETIAALNSEFELNSDKLRVTVSSNCANLVETFKEFECDFDDNSAEEFQDHAQYVHCCFAEKPPKDIVCAAHTLTLVATNDFTNILKNTASMYTTHKGIMQKCSSLWKKARKRMYVETVFVILGEQLKFPVATEWNSLSESISVLLAHKNTINELCKMLQTPKFNSEEFQYLEEYMQVLKPIADAIDFLQQDNGRVFGFLLPTLATIKTKYYKLRHYQKLKFFGSVVIHMEAALQQRFKAYCDLETELNDAIVASVLCPEVKLNWVRALDRTCDENKIKKINTMVKSIVMHEFGEQTQASSSPQRPNINFFDFSCTDDPTENRNNVPVDNDIEYYAYLADPSTSIEMLDKYPSMKKAYFKYNTPLPSSADVERLFPMAAVINAPQRGAISDSTFEKLFLLKVNNAI